MKATTHKFFLLIILALLFNCCTRNKIKSENTDNREYALVNKIRKEVFFQLEKENDLHAFGTGSQMMDKIKMLHFGFRYYHETDIDNARNLLVKAGNLVLDKINSLEEIRQYLENYPFKPKNIEIVIFLYNPNGSDRGPEKLQTISMKEGSLRYENDILDAKGFQTIIYEETYEEALNKLRSIAQSTEQARELPRSEIFPPQDGKTKPLQGKIVAGRYYAPRDIFSCQADNFGASTYLAQDILIDEQAMCVGFYNSIGDFKHAETMFLRKLRDKVLDGEALKRGFESFGIGILKEVDNAQGIEILREEMIDNLFFAAISIGRTSVLRSANGEHPSATRGYLVFQNKDKLVILSNQLVTPQGQKHIPQKHVERLKSEILEFKKTFEFGPTPVLERSI